MRREARLYLSKAVDSLVLGIELFNRPSDQGRVSSVLILIDHSFEMFLKAAIVQRGGRIREEGAAQNIGFTACVNKGFSDGGIQFLTDEQALALQSINGLRDAAQHDLLDISEAQLYLHAQSAVTLFRDLLCNVFKLDLNSRLSNRVLPIATMAPLELTLLFENETEEIKKLLMPGRRRQTEAFARLRPLAILDANLQGSMIQPTQESLGAQASHLKNGLAWDQVFPGVAAVQLVADGDGPTISFRFTKREGLPIQAVAASTPGAFVVGVKRVSDQDFYNLTHSTLAGHLGLTQPKLTAVIRYLKLKDDADCFKEFIFGKTKHPMYSQRAIAKIKEALTERTMDEIWAEAKPKGHTVG